MEGASPIVYAVVAAVVIVAIVIGADVLREQLNTRTELIREQKAREDAAQAANRKRDEYERDIDLVASVFDPLGLFH